MTHNSAIRSRAAIAYLSLTALAWAGACLDGTGPRPAIVYGLIVSDTAARRLPAASGVNLSLGIMSETDVVYVSLPPGETPDGTWATIRNPGTGSTVTTPVNAGGFDPIAISAVVGNTLDIVVRNAANAVVLEAQLAVAPRRRPIVVRTDPPPKKRDVPLNAAILIVFSEPIDARSVSTESIRLLRGGSPVAGRVELSSDGLRAAFQPDAVLAPNTDYSLEVSTTVTDRDGDALELPTQVSFRTGTSAPLTVSFMITPNPLLSVPSAAFGSGVPLRATMLDAVGNEHPIAGLMTWRSTDSTVVGWGCSLCGELGSTGSYVGPNEISAYVLNPGSATITVTAGGMTATTTVVVEDVAFDAVTVGVNYPTCFLTVAGTAYCMGDNRNGELGIGHRSWHAENPVGVAGGLSFTAISTGWFHTCALTSANAAHCWGENRFGQLGDGTTIAVRDAPTPVASGLAFVQIGSGWSHTCALSDAGKAYCWGAYGWAIVDSITYDPAAALGPVPTPVPGELTFTQLRVGGAHACGLDAGGAAYCWGMNLAGQLGDGSVVRSFSPVAVTGGHTFVAIDGGMAHTCGVTIAGEVYCWGGDGAGTNFEAGNVTIPTRIDLPPGVALIEIAAGFDMTCGLTSDGAAYCWGWTYLNGGSGPEVFVPPQRIGNETFKAIDAGNNRAWGVTTSSDVRYWTTGNLSHR